MADVAGGDSVTAKEGLLEGEDTEKTGDVLAQRSDPSLPPGPRLRCDQIDHGNTSAMELPRQRQMEIGRIGQNRQIRAFSGDGAHQLAVFAIDPGDVGHHLHQTHYGQRTGVDNGPDPCRLHAQPGTPKEFGVGMAPAQRFDDARRVKITRCFTGGDEDAH